MKTEAEARKCWCPFARVVEVSEDVLHGPFNRYHPDSGQWGQTNNVARCIASECMAWEWERLAPFNLIGDGDTDEEEDVVKHFIGRGWKLRHDGFGSAVLFPPETAVGDCGLKRGQL